MLGEIDIRQLRKGKGLTQTQLGILCGMGKSQICRMEKGELGSPETIARVLEPLGYKLVIGAKRKSPKSPALRETVLDMLSSYLRNNSRRYGIESIGLFGSVARCDHKAGSDIDIIITLEKPSLYKLAAIRQDLETVFCRKVDLVSASSRMSEQFKQQLNQDVIYV